MDAVVGLSSTDDDLLDDCNHRNEENETSHYISLPTRGNCKVG